MWKRLWMDEGGTTIAAELLLVMAILVIGTIVGRVTLRDAFVSELADVAAPLGGARRELRLLRHIGGRS